LSRSSKRIGSATNLAVDVETTGLDPFVCALVGISLAVHARRGLVYPRGALVFGSSLCSWTPGQAFRKVLAPFLGDANLPKIGQNLKFDSQVLARAGMPLSPISFDTLVASYCLNPGRQTHGLKTLALDFLG
jgi:DNA polymerase-1